MNSKALCVLVLLVSCHDEVHVSTSNSNVDVRVDNDDKSTLVTVTHRKEVWVPVFLPLPVAYATHAEACP